MADFSDVPINVTAEQIERIASMDLTTWNEGGILDSASDNELPTSKAVRQYVKNQLVGGIVKKVNEQQPDSYGTVHLGAVNVPYDGIKSTYQKIEEIYESAFLAEKKADDAHSSSLGALNVALDAKSMADFANTAANNAMSEADRVEQQASEWVNELWEEKQDKLTAGKNIKINGNEIEADVSLTAEEVPYDDVQSTKDKIDTLESEVDLFDEIVEAKQDKLTAGNNITIEGNVISASGGGGSFGYPKKIFDTTVTVDNQSTTILAEIDANGTANYTELFVRCRIYSIDGAVAFNVSGKNITFQVNESDTSAATKFGTVAILTTTWNTAHSRCLYGHIRVLENSIVCETNTPANSTNLDGELYSLTTERTGCPLSYSNFTKVKRFRVAMTQSGAPVFPIGTRLEIWAR